MSKDQTIGSLIFLVCIVIIIAYSIMLFWPALETLRIWIIAIPVFIAFVAVMGIGAWIGWTMASTPPPTPTERLMSENAEEKVTTENEKTES